MRFLFFKPAFAWPHSSGHDVHTFQMMRALADAGARVGVVTRQKPVPEALEGARLDLQVALDDEVDERTGPAALKLRPLEERFRSYWGVAPAHVAALGHLATRFAADAVVVSGLDVLPMTGGIAKAVTVWYAADEWLWHHWSQLRLLDRRTWGHVRDGALKGLYERAYRRRLDRAWVVSDRDRVALRTVAGVTDIDVIPNGVDAAFYHPRSEREEPGTAVFWGRLDFGPNIQGLEWFCHRVWPRVREARPDARFTIIGFKPGEAVRALATLPGVTMSPDLDDIRPDVARHAVVVLPFVSGGGIKNKLLEAAAMAKAVVCTSRARIGLRQGAPVRISDSPEEWSAALQELWNAPDARRALGQSARDWVMREHTWAAAAATALAGVEQSLRTKGRT